MTYAHISKIATCDTAGRPNTEDPCPHYVCTSNDRVNPQRECDFVDCESNACMNKHVRAMLGADMSPVYLDYHEEEEEE